MALKLLILFLAGGLGTLARFGVDRGATALGRAWAQGVPMPWGTAAVNLLGCFGFGVVAAWLEPRTNLSPHLKLAALTGFMGAFTTFSTFAFQAVELMRDGKWAWAAGKLVLHNGLGLLLVLAGFALVRAAGGAVAPSQSGL